MKQGILTLEAYTGDGAADAYRAIIKTRHSRNIYLAVELTSGICTITHCFYADRNRGKSGAARYSSKPLKLRTINFPADNLLRVAEAELDCVFYGVEFIRNETYSLLLDEYLQVKSAAANTKYRFLIMIGDGNSCDELPDRLQTRIKNKLHRTIYIELSRYSDGKGVVSICHYCDRQYKRSDIKITAQQLVSYFFPYTHEGVLSLINNELCCDFTHIIITSGINLDDNNAPLCGAL